MKYKVTDVIPKNSDQYEIHYDVIEQEEVVDADLIITLGVKNIPPIYVVDVVKTAIKNHYAHIKQSGLLLQSLKTLEFDEYDYPEKNKVYGAYQSY